SLKGRDLSAALGLSPRQHSPGGKQRLGSISRMGGRTISRLPVIGGSSLVRQACRFGAPAGSWLERMLARKPRMLVAVAGANICGRPLWQGLFIRMALIGCFHMSGLFVRRFGCRWP